MDPATLIGILLAFGSVFAMVTMEGGHVSSLLLPAPMVLVFGATLAVGLAGSTLRDTLHAFKSVPAAIKGKTVDPVDSIEQVVALAEKARSEGLLSLEAEAQDTKDRFLSGALQNIADGTDGDELRLMLEDEIHSKRVSDHTGSRFFKALGGYAPTIGIIGTVVSLTHVLENLSDPSNLGPMIASAFVATLWGLLSANFMWLPLGDRLAKISELEIERMTLLMEGVLAVQAGSQPLLLRERLMSMVPPHKLNPSKSGSASGRSGARGEAKGGKKDKLKAAA
jgi:chemotaxis protein MotA